MSILSDREIHMRCQYPSHVYTSDKALVEQLAWTGITHTEDQLMEDIIAGKAEIITHKTINESGWVPMIAPFSPKQNRVDENNNKVISWGLSSFGYDVRLSNKFKIFTNVRNAVIDPLALDDDCFVDHEGDFCIIPPNSYILGYSKETFNIPKDIMCLCVGKSTYARLAALVNVTPIEPGFIGQVVIEIANCSTLPLKVYANQGIAQFLFLKGESDCMVSYADRNGKYQHQYGLQTAIV